GAYVATTIAEYFRDQGKDVILMMDSLTRFALAQREIGLATGEPPTTKGFTPSVFTNLPKLLERAGTSDTGSITGIYTVLVEGDDLDEPISDAARGILDGHIVLTRDLAHKNHYPAIDVLQSISRLMNKIIPKDRMEKANVIKNLMAEYKKNEDMITIGMYVKGSSANIDAAIALKDKIDEFLTQEIEAGYSYEETMMLMDEIIAYLRSDIEEEDESGDSFFSDDSFF
ncbi:MAG TPA: EscN/YscN/HrcN family type III secretion system ATPase, partial [Spirochaetota bacterium]|nr:EscN/YscN/HrcN family type III secretion system ATPase [Spirochaetota bacterium]